LKTAKNEKTPQFLMLPNLVENAIRRPAMNRRNALFAGHDEGGAIGLGLPVLSAPAK
jgi:hypothetical protein